jgi:hypothetical protein
LAVQQSPTGLQVILHDSQQARPVTVQAASYDQVILKLNQADLPPTLMVNTEDAPLVSHVLVEQSPNGDALITLQGHKLSSPTLLWQVPAVAQASPDPAVHASPLASLGWLKPLAKQALSTLAQPVTALALALLALLTGVAVWAGRKMTGAVKAEAAVVEANPATSLPDLPAQAQGLRFGASRYATQPATPRQAKATPVTAAVATAPANTPLPAAASLKQSQGYQRYGQVAVTAPTPVAGKTMTRPSTVRTVRDTLPSAGATSKATRVTSAASQANQQQRHAFLEAMAAHAQTQGHANLAHALRLNQR